MCHTLRVIFLGPCALCGELEMSLETFLHVAINLLIDIFGT